MGGGSHIFDIIWHYNLLCATFLLPNYAVNRVVNFQLQWSNAASLLLSILLSPNLVDLLTVYYSLRCIKSIAHFVLSQYNFFTKWATIFMDRREYICSHLSLLLWNMDNEVQVYSVWKII